MQIIRFRDPNNQPTVGWVDGEKVGAIRGSVFGEYQREEATLPLAKLHLLPPVQPSKIICLGRNFPDQAREQNAVLPEMPMLFLKPPSALIAAGETILLPSQSQQVEFEGELAVVIGRRGKKIPADTVRHYILGYTIANDITARDLQEMDSQWTRAKGFDTFCPLGPWIETELNPFDVLISTHLNGVLRQMSSTREMNFPVYQLVTYITSIMTLEPGDVILTGTPAGGGRMVDGDYVKVTIDGIGELMNPVASLPEEKNR